MTISSLHWSRCQVTADSDTWLGQPPPPDWSLPPCSGLWLVTRPPTILARPLSVDGALLVKSQISDSCHNNKSQWPSTSTMHLPFWLFYCSLLFILIWTKEFKIGMKFKFISFVLELLDIIDLVLQSASQIYEFPTSLTFRLPFVPLIPRIRLQLLWRFPPKILNFNLGQNSWRFRRKWFLHWMLFSKYDKNGSITREEV